MTLQVYEEFYTYDAVGNILKMQHTADSNAWTRNYQYDKKSNRLLATKEGSRLDYEFYVDMDIEEERRNLLSSATLYRYDKHGNMLNLHNTDEDLISWDYRDMIQQYNL